MKTKSALIRSIGALALFVLIAFPNSSALAAPKCGDPIVYYEYDGPTGLEVYMENTEDNLCLPCSSSTETPIIFFTVTTTVANNTNPTHNGPNPINCSIYTQGIPVPYGYTQHYRVITYKGCCSHQDSNVVVFDVTNPVP